MRITSRGLTLRTGNHALLALSPVDQFAQQCMAYACRKSVSILIGDCTDLA